MCCVVCTLYSTLYCQGRKISKMHPAIIRPFLHSPAPIAADFSLKGAGGEGGGWAALYNLQIAKWGEGGGGCDPFRKTVLPVCFLGIVWRL